MNHAVKYGSIILIVVVTLMGWIVQASYGGGAGTGSPLAQAQARTTSDLAVGESTRVDLAADTAGIEALTPRERDDQLRDWLLFAAVAALDKPAEEYGRIFFDLPTSRQGYLRPIGTFEYGKTRSRYINDGVVIALLPADQTDAERIDDLTRIADSHRKNLGDAFSRLLVVEYRIEESASQATLVRRDDIAYERLFSPVYGYVEGKVSDLDGFRAFIGSIDDLTFAKKTPAGMILGGRKLQSRSYGTIGIEEIASVWKAERKIQISNAEFAALSQRLQREYHQKWASRTASSSEELSRLRSEADAEWTSLESRLREDARARRLVRGVGFSLDPDIDFASLRSAFDRIWPQIAKIASLPSAIDPSAVSSALGEKDIVPFRQVVGELSRGGNGVVSMLLQRLERANSYQVARYDGDLKGTEVGMVLFYTDLIAKLWTIDFVETSPSHAAILDFVDDPSVPNSLIFQAERDELRSARLWFGHANSGLQFAEGGDGVYFARNATRIYSAGSNPEKPGVETQTSSFLAASIDWWNDHYEEVAEYEPQYERLNEIMKWSVVIGWLSGAGEIEKLAFMDPVEVVRSHVFPKWARKNRELRYSRWDEVAFHPPGYKGTKTESLPLLSGAVTEGGVSLATKEVATRSTLRGDVLQLMRRSNLDYRATPNANLLRTIEGAEFTIKGGGPERFSIGAVAKEDAKQRSTWAQLAHSEVELTVGLKPGRMSLETRVAESPLGDLQITRRGNGFTIGWHSREVEHAHSLGRRLSVEDPDAVLLADPLVETIVRLDAPAEYAVKLHGSPRWIRFAPESAPRTDIDPAWLVRAADAESNALRVMQAKVLEEADLIASLPAEGRLAVESSDKGKTVLRWIGVAGERPDRVASLESGVGRMEAWTDESGRLILAPPRGADTRVLSAARELREADIDALRAAIGAGDSASVSTDARFLAAMERGDYRSAAWQIGADPARAKSTLDLAFAEDLTNYEAVRASLGPADALHFIDRLIGIYGRRADLLMRRGLIQVERGNLADVAEDLMQAPARLRDRAAFFDEVNARLEAGGSAKENLYRFAEFADLQDRGARLGEGVGGRARPRFDGQRFDFDFELQKTPDTAVAVSDLSALDGALIYRQHSVQLDSIDWTAPIDQALLHVIEGRLGKVVQLPEGDIARYRPGQIWTPDADIALKPVASTHVARNVTTTARVSYVPCSSLDAQACEEEPPDAGSGRQILLVLAD